MFKLIKIVNSGTNVSEPCKLPKSLTTTMKIGMPLILKDGKVSGCGETDKPTHIAMCNVGNGDKEVLCYEVNSNMHFETIASISPTALSIGKTYTLAIDNDGIGFGVTAATTSGVATIIDLCGAKAAGDKITVKFN